METINTTLDLDNKCANGMYKFGETGFYLKVKENDDYTEVFEVVDNLDDVVLKIDTTGCHSFKDILVTAQDEFDAFYEEYQNK